MSIDNATPDEWRDAASQAAFDAKFAAENAAVGLTPEDVEALNRVLDRPFCEVPYVTRAYVFLLHQMHKVRVMRRIADEYRDITAQPNWSPSTFYRVEKVEPPKTKPSIDWSHIPPEYKWLARDSNGAPYVFGHKPECLNQQWDAPSPYTRIDVLVSYAPGDCDWKDSLVERPAGV